jgi:hypothetical protein
MTIDQFADITRRVILKDSPEKFLPTALYPSRLEIVALDDLPAVDDPVALAVEWASSRARGGEEFLLAVLLTPEQFVVVHQHDGTLETRRFDLVSPAA